MRELGIDINMKQLDDRFVRWRNHHQPVLKRRTEKELRKLWLVEDYLGIDMGRLNGNELDLSYSTFIYDLLIDLFNNDNGSAIMCSKATTQTEFITGINLLRNNVIFGTDREIISWPKNEIEKVHVVEEFMYPIYLVLNFVSTGMIRTRVLPHFVDKKEDENDATYHLEFSDEEKESGAEETERNGKVYSK